MININKHRIKKLGMVLLIGLWSTQNVFAGLVFVTEENAVNADNFILDFDDSSTDFIDLDFGSSLVSQIRYDVLNDKFIINENLDLASNQLLNARMENLAVAPTCDATNGGHIYFNTVDKLTYTCDGTSTWNPLENALNATIEFPVVQARRTTSFTLPTTYADVDLDTTDLENDASTIDHDDTLRDRIDIGATAMYQIIYGYTAGGSATGTHEARARVRVNDTTVLPGSASVNKNYQGEFSTTSASFLANLTDGDFISLQLQRDATTDVTQDEIYFSIIKLEGIKGEKGDKGDAGVDGVSSGITNSETFTIDNDNTGGDLSLVFGQTLNETLTWDNTNTRFNLSDGLNLLGNLTVGAAAETIDTDGGAFSLTGDDIFVADSLGVEGAIYTDDTATKYHYINIFGCVRGSASNGTVASGRSPVVRFDGVDSSQIRCATTVPDDWVAGTDINYDIFWSPSDNTTGDLFLEFDRGSFGVGDDVTASFTNTNLPTQTVAVNTQSDIYSVTATIPAADIATGEIQNFRFRRSPANAADTYAGDINIHMIRLSYTGKKLK